MGEVIKFPKPEGDISDTDLGKSIIEVAKPLFQGAIDSASIGTEYHIGLDDGEWTVVPLDGIDNNPDTAS